MRLVFLLYAEDRDLLPTSRDGAAQALWQSGYSVKTLFARLEDDTSLHPDTMDERRGAWGQLLAAVPPGPPAATRTGSPAAAASSSTPTLSLSSRAASARRTPCRPPRLRRLHLPHPRRLDDAPRRQQGRRARTAVLPHPRRRADRLGLRDRHGFHCRLRLRADDRSGGREGSAKLHRHGLAPRPECRPTARSGSGSNRSS